MAAIDSAMRTDSCWAVGSIAACRGAAGHPRARAPGPRRPWAVIVYRVRRRRPTGSLVARASPSATSLSGPFEQGLEDAARTAALDALRATIDAHGTPVGVLYRSAVWLVTATRS